MTEIKKSEKEFTEYCKKTSEKVDSWPKWMKDIGFYLNEEYLN